MLAELVREGKLPPLDQRLPLDPYVGTDPRLPADMKLEKGSYGGTLRTIDATGAEHGVEADAISTPRWMTSGGAGHDPTTATGDMIKSLEISPDAKVFTVHMRRGMKFSNGADFDSGDVAFWWNDQILNTDLTPAFPQNYRAGAKPTGTPAKFEVIDQYTFKFTFDEPYGGFPSLMTYFGFPPRITDSDFLKQWHIKYGKSDEIAAKAKELGFGEKEWYRVYGYYNNYANAIKTGMPGLGPWVPKERTDTATIWERNPYYWKVDDWGQQLPYIDYVENRRAPNSDAGTLVITNGEVDWAHSIINPTDLPVYAQYAKEKGYTLDVQSSHASLDTVFLNLTYDDPVWRKYAGNKEFRTALSMAIDRTHIRDAVYFGNGTFNTTIPQPAYDPAGAKAIFDKLGLDKIDADGCRVDKDTGKRVEVFFNYANFYSNLATPVVELVAKYWNDVGICAKSKTVEQGLFLTQTGANQTQAMVWWAQYPMWPYHEGNDMLGVAWQQTYAPLWVRWYDWNVLGGKETAKNPKETDPLVVGIEPPPEYLKLRELYSQILATADMAESQRLFTEMKRIFTEEHYTFPIMDFAPDFLLVNTKLGNAPVGHGGIANFNKCFGGKYLFFKQ
jgi:peptide/nickel transport system substrate-binding protein